MPQGGQQGGGADNSLAPIWAGVALTITVMLFWHYKHELIVRFVFFLDAVQAKMVNVLWPGEPLSELILNLQTLDPLMVDFNTLIDLTIQVGMYTRYIYGFILICLAFRLYQYDLSHKFCKLYSMKSLSVQEQENWPAISPVVQQDLAKVSIDEGPWAMALNPMEFSRKYKLLKKSDLLLDTMAPGLEMTASIRKPDAKRIFTMQIGPLWEGFAKCHPHVQALAAIFLARVNRDRDAASRISNHLNTSFAKGKIDYSIAYPILKKYMASELVNDLNQQHAYVYTFMATLLEKARQDGVVPSSEFLWLKSVDRRLWYMLNCVGRQTPFAEISGAFAHWKAEKAMKRRSLTPMVEEAIKALEIAIKEVKLTDKEMETLPL